jgi:hypothetical protein
MTDDEATAVEILRKIRASEKARQRKYIEAQESEGLRRTLVWLHEEVIHAVDSYASTHGIRTRGEAITALVNKALQPSVPMQEPAASTGTPQTTNVLAEMPKDAVPSRQAAELLGFKSPSALDNAIRGTDYQLGFVKQGMKGSGRQAVFIGKGKAEHGGPDRNLWRIEDDAPQSG